MISGRRIPFVFVSSGGLTTRGCRHVPFVFVSRGGVAISQVAVDASPSYLYREEDSPPVVVGVGANLAPGTPSYLYRMEDL